MKSETPRTDEASFNSDVINCVESNFARKLERELNAALSSLEYIVKTDKIMRPDICHVQAEKILAKTHGRDA